MILSNTDEITIFNTLAKEQEKVDYAVRKAFNKAKSNFFKCNRFPYVYTELYTHPESKNTYLIYYYADSKKAAMYVTVHSGGVLLVNEDNGNRSVYRIRLFTDVVKENSIYDEEFDSLSHYTGHFFSRYRERAKVSSDYNTLEGIAIFFGRNSRFDAKLHENEVIKFPEKYKNCVAYQIQDGVTFGSEYKKGNILCVEYKTFLSSSELKENQMEHVMQTNDLYEIIEDMKKSVVPKGEGRISASLFHNKLH